jgi:HrpA-like RNA helicase
LKLKYLGVVDNIEQFDWLESPSLESIRDAIKSLEWLNALDRSTGKITDIGRLMAKLGLSPMLSAMILKGKDMPCTSHIIALAGMLSVAQNVWWRSKDPALRKLADEKRAYFAHDNDQGGDHIQLLKIFLEWEKIERGEKRSLWCRDNMINGKAMNMALEFCNETQRQLGDIKIDFKSITLDQNLVDQILLCITAGYFQNLAVSNGSLKAGYQLVSAEKISAQVHRSSVLTLGQKPAGYVLYHEILNLNGTNCMTVVCPVQLDWLPKLWHDSVSRRLTELVFVNHVFSNIGPALMCACLGKCCAKKLQLEDFLSVVLDVNYDEKTLTIWCQADKLNKARLHLEQLMKIEREKLIKEVEEYEIVGTTRILLGEGGEPISILIKDEYVKVIVKGLPANTTEQEIEKKFQMCGKSIVD